MAYKYYGVKIGLIPGIYYTWEECRKNVSGYPKGEYKGFNNEVEAHQYVFGNLALNNVNENFDALNMPYGEAIAYVDGSYSEKTNIPTYGIVFITNGNENRFSGIVEDKSLHTMKNVAGELEAAICSLKIAKAIGIKKLTIYHDYTGISAWYKKEWKANKKGVKRYCEICEDMKDYINVKFVHIKGHSGDYYNEMADSLAAQMQEKIQQKKKKKI